ncbi:hypothetical protein Ae201684P_018610 [Aphanomyces euteiches]|uniref:RBR-type E3 ubiquitin transferase n=1 Tax=Aphanomyces euteiches TaxID=100861 RepID=A0A6G0XVC0_9STRA|nr:hypothetical protein Ae201684_000980 [Aphanomyces euteiches]KAH9099597.1 hypothetical protein Ae201684P_018610 [Aphanomyces euteiches]
MEPLAELEPTNARPVDLFFVCDTTGSMGSYISSLASTIRQVLAVVKVLFRGRVKVHVVSYKDYCDARHGIVTHRGQRKHSDEELMAFIAKLGPIGGGDYPEAVKTALNFTLHLIDTIALSEPSDSLVIIYTDAPPHHQKTGSDYEKQEKAEIDSNANYRAGYDWIGIRDTLNKANVPVYTFHSYSSSSISSILFYDLLGPVIPLTDTSTINITRATISLLMHLVGHPFEHNNLYNRADVTLKGQFVKSMPYDNENELPVKSNLQLVNGPFAFDALEFMREDLTKLPLRFKTETDYQDLVYSIFQEIFTPTNVLAITYNPILGKLWRLVASRRLDDRLQELSTKLSQCVPALNGDSKAQVQKWIEDSHNECEFIRDTIAVNASLSQRPCLVLEAGIASIDMDDLRSLARAPNPGVIKSVQSILTHLRLLPDLPANAFDDEGTPQFIPLDLSDRHLFAFLPHLVHGGTTFSLRGAAVLAMLCCLSGQTTLKDRAEAFLDSLRGDWIPLDKAVDIPECLSLEFVKLMYRGRQYLTETEQLVYTQLRTIYRLRLAATKSVEASIGFVPSKSEVRPDYKAKCESCGFMTSVSLMVTPTKCAHCAERPLEEAIALQREHAMPRDQSHLVECRTCCGIYAVTQVELLNITPKCFYCRHDVANPPAKVECRGCRNLFIDPAGLLGPLTDWKCAVCVQTPHASLTTKTLPFEAFLVANPTWATRFGLLAQTASYVETLFNRHLNYFKLFTQHHDVIFPTDKTPLVDPSTHIVVSGKPVHDVAELAERLTEDILRGSLKDVCNLCFEECLLPAMESACGRCEARVCGACLDAWYGETKPGRMVLLTHLTCAFCRRNPTVATLKKHNKVACALIRSKPEMLRSDMYYGWCVSCYGVKEMVGRDCAVEAPRDVTGFECVECKEKSVVAWQDEGKSCPGCKTPTEKVDGCNHMTCVCGQHWCYVCCVGFDNADDTYAHLYEEHGGAF